MHFEMHFWKWVSKTALPTLICPVITANCLNSLTYSPPHGPFQSLKPIANINSILLQCKRLEEKKKRKKPKPLWSGMCETLSVGGMATGGDGEQPISAQAYGVRSDTPCFLPQWSLCCELVSRCTGSLCSFFGHGQDHLRLFQCLWDLWLGWDGERSMSLSGGDRARESGCFRRNHFVSGRNISISQMLFFFFFSSLLRKTWVYLQEQLQWEVWPGSCSWSHKRVCLGRYPRRVWTGWSLQWELDIFYFLLLSNTQRDLNKRWQWCRASSLAATKGGWKSIWKSQWRARLWFDLASSVFIGSGISLMLDILRFSIFFKKILTLHESSNKKGIMEVKFYRMFKTGQLFSFSIFDWHSSVLQYFICLLLRSNLESCDHLKVTAFLCRNKG